MKAIQHFVLGMQFLTRIRLTRRNMPCEPQDFRGAMNFFTIIGLLIGFLQYVVYKGVYFLSGEVVLAAVLATFTGVFLTGGLHLDGLADLFDGLGAQKNRERTLEIMKDSRVGSFGAISLILDLSLHIAGYMALKYNPSLILFVPALGKWMVILLCYTGKNATQGMGALWIENIKATGVLLNTAVLFVALFAEAGITKTPIVMGKGVAVLAAYATMLYIRKLVTQRLGGVTGDCLGATQQIGEWIALIVLACIRI